MTRVKYPRMSQEKADLRLEQLRNIWRRFKGMQRSFPIEQLQPMILDQFMWYETDDRDNVEVFATKDGKVVSYWDWNWDNLDLDDQSCEPGDEAEEALNTWIGYWVKPGMQIVVLHTHHCPGCCQNGLYNIGCFTIEEW